MNPIPDQPAVHLEEINADTVRAVCRLSDTLTPLQQRMVADNAVSIAQAHFSAGAWFRAIYLGETPIGFLMLHIGSDSADGIDCPGAFLWRFMIAGPYQRRGYGREAINLLIRHLQAQGYAELYTSCGEGEGSPQGFYAGLGFVPTGEYYDDEIELVLCFAGGAGEDKA